MNWAALPESSVRRSSRVPFLVRHLVPFALAAVGWALGLTLLAAVIALVALVLGIVALITPQVEAAIVRSLATVGRGAGTALGFVLLSVVHVLVFLPVSLVLGAVGRDPLQPAPAAAGTVWRPHPGRVPPKRTFAGDHQRVNRSLPTRILVATPRVVGAIMLLVLADLGLGTAWDQIALEQPDDSSSPHPLSGEGVLAAPAFVDESWADAYAAEFDGLAHEYRPFVLERLADVDGAMISSHNGIRTSYEPVDRRAPVVWCFGGSALWGVGQRDGQTIPSMIARLAEEAGQPLIVRNFGGLGYTSWQSALRFEQELAVRPAPALVVFYDGTDDVAVQLERPDDQPTHYDVDGLTTALTGQASLGEQTTDLWETYRRRSILRRLANRVSGLFGSQPAWADDDELVARVSDLHQRSVAVARHVAGRRGVPTLFAWQAAEGVDGDGGAYRQLAATGGPHDLSDVLDDQREHFLDGVLTDEIGAELVAEALWPLVDAALD